MKTYFAFAFFILTANLFAQYDINDPRNPDCPCHKYQKIADEEYQKLIAAAESKNKKESLSNTHLSNATAITLENKKSGDRKDETKVGFSKKRSLHLKFKNFKKMKTKQKRNNNSFFNFLKRRKATDSCFHW